MLVCAPGVVGVDGWQVVLGRLVVEEMRTRQPRKRPVPTSRATSSDPQFGSKTAFRSAVLPVGDVDEAVSALAAAARGQSTAAHKASDADATFERREFHATDCGQTLILVSRECPQTRRAFNLCCGFSSSQMGRLIGRGSIACDSSPADGRRSSTKDRRALRSARVETKSAKVAQDFDDSRGQLLPPNCASSLPPLSAEKTTSVLAHMFFWDSAAVTLPIAESRQCIIPVTERLVIGKESSTTT